MNLKFGLLWLEDQYSGAEKQKIENAARGHGFEIEITNRDDGSNLQELARRQKSHYPFDLILVDWDLKFSSDGADAAKLARELFPATPILFYSAKKPLAELKNMIFTRGVEGVFVSERGQFAERTGDLIGNLASSFNRLAGMRGLAARVLAECDDYHRQIIEALSECGMENELVAAFEEYVISDSAAQAKSFDNAKSGGVTGLLASRSITSMTLFKSIRRISKNEQFRQQFSGDEVASTLRSLRKFDHQVISVRNTLGHALEVQTEDGWKIQGVDADGITVERFPELRRDFLDNLSAVKNLHRLLVRDEPNQDSS